MFRLQETITQSMFGELIPGSTGDPPVPSGDSPDGMGAAVPSNRDSLFACWFSAVPVGGSPPRTGESPVLPIFKTRSQGDQTLPKNISPLWGWCQKVVPVL